MEVPPASQEPAPTERKGRPLWDPASLSLEAIPDALAEIERVRAILWTRLSERPAEASDAAQIEAGDSDCLTPEGAARVLGVSVRWLYRHWKELPFARKLSRKTLRFSEKGLRRWLDTRRSSRSSGDSRSWYEEA